MVWGFGRVTSEEHVTHLNLTRIVESCKLKAFRTKVWNKAEACMSQNERNCQTVLSLSLSLSSYFCVQVYCPRGMLPKVDVFEVDGQGPLVLHQASTRVTRTLLKQKNERNCSVNCSVCVP